MVIGTAPATPHFIFCSRAHSTGQFVESQGAQFAPAYQLESSGAVHGGVEAALDQNTIRSEKLEKKAKTGG